MVIAQFRSRSKRGIEKYNTTLAENDLSLVEWLEHAKEEAMDQVLYLERAINEIRSKENSIQ
jgi:succinate dehydrogenase flavin-adding protein (antitoxin of CptAB toxin-antitoxin module)